MRTLLVVSGHFDSTRHVGGYQQIASKRMAEMHSTLTHIQTRREVREDVPAAESAPCSAYAQSPNEGYRNVQREPPSCGHKADQINPPNLRQ